MSINFLLGGHDTPKETPMPKGKETMKIELKAIKYSDFASHETNCYTAKIYIDGRLFALVSNDGRGGSDDVYPPNNARREDIASWRKRLMVIETELAKELLPVGDDDKGRTIENCLEIECGARMNEWHQMNEVKKILRRVSYLKTDGKLYQLAAKYKPTADTLKQVKACGWFTDDYTMISGLKPDDAHKALTDAGFFK
jgi:hypothetical protein